MAMRRAALAVVFLMVGYATYAIGSLAWAVQDEAPGPHGYSAAIGRLAVEACWNQPSNWRTLYHVRDEGDGYQRVILGCPY